MISIFVAELLDTDYGATQTKSGHLHIPLQWRQNGRNDVSNHQPHDCLLNCSGADQRKHQSSALLAFVMGIHRWPVNSPHKGPVTRKMFPFDDVIMPCWFVSVSATSPHMLKLSEVIHLANWSFLIFSSRFTSILFTTLSPISTVCIIVRYLHLFIWSHRPEYN